MLVQHQNDLCVNAAPIGIGSPASGTTIGATLDADLPYCGTDVTAPGVWYTFVAPSIVSCPSGSVSISGHPTVSTCDGATWDTKISVFSGSCDSPICVTGCDDCGPCASSFQTEFEIPVTAGETYNVLVHGFDDLTGSFDLDLDYDLELTCYETIPTPSTLTVRDMRRSHAIRIAVSTCAIHSSFDFLLFGTPSSM